VFFILLIRCVRWVLVRLSLPGKVLGLFKAQQAGQGRAGLGWAGCGLVWRGKAGRGFC